MTSEYYKKDNSIFKIYLKRPMFFIAFVIERSKSYRITMQYASYPFIVYKSTYSHADSEYRFQKQFLIEKILKKFGFP